MIGNRIPTITIYLFIPILLFLSSCTTNIYLYDRSDAPFFCNQSYNGPYETVSKDYEPFPVNDRYLDFFVLKKIDNSEFLIIKNKIDFLGAEYKNIYVKSFFHKKLIGAKVVVHHDMNGMVSNTDNLIKEIKIKYPNAMFRRPSMVDVTILLFSPWLAVDYAKKPCESLILGDLFLEFRLLPEEVREFDQLQSDTLVLGGTVTFTDYPSGWRFSRSFSLRKNNIF